MLPMIGSHRLSYVPDSGDKSADPQFDHKRFNSQSVTAGDHQIPEFTSISDQLSLGTCSVNAVCDALEMLIGIKDPNRVVQLSRLHLYWITRCLFNATQVDVGVSIRDALRQAHKVGVCEESLWPYIESNAFTPPPLIAAIKASENRISGHYRISSNGQDRIEAVASAIRSNHPVIIGTLVGEPFRQWKRGLNPLHPPIGIPSGGHSFILTGVQSVAGRLVFSVRNSWGATYGDVGHCLIDQDYVSYSQTYDVWVATQMDFVLQ